MELQVGSPAPDFALPTVGDTTIRLSSFAGRKVVLFFYPKDDTSGCTQEAQEFDALREKFAAARTDLVGISPDSPKKHRKFLDKYGLRLDLASDETKGTLESYGVWAQKSMWGRKYMGVERTTFLIGRDGRIARIWSKVKVPGHAAEVLAAAEAL